MALRLLLAIDSQFEALAEVAIYSFLLHTKLEQVVVVTPANTVLQRAPQLVERFKTSFRQVAIPAQAACNQLTEEIRPYFYCIEAMEQVCHGELASTPGRYLYVDADTCCVRDLAPLERLSLDSAHPVAACSHGRPMVDRQLVLELESPYHYFNAGVILFESEHLGKLTNSKSIVEFYRNNQAVCRFREQCALNAVLRGRVRYLPNQFNYLSWMRPRATSNPWHQLANNPMAYYLEHVREELAIAHFSAGAIPTNVGEDKLEAVDRYWLGLSEELKLSQARAEANSP